MSLMRKILAAFSLLVSISAIYIAYETFWQANQKLVISAGPEGGTYLPLAKGLAKVINEKLPHIDVEVIDSQGSIENISRLKKGRAQLALVQNDCPGDDRVRTVLPLHKEVLHFLVHVESEIKEIHDLRGKKVAVGEEDSGNVVLVKNLLHHYGITMQDLDAKYISASQAGELLLNKEIDAMLVVAGLRPSACEKAIGTGKVRFVGLGKVYESGGQVEGLNLNYPFVAPFTLPALTYSSKDAKLPGRPPEPIATLVVQSLLVSTDKLSDDIVHDISKVILENRSKLIASQRVAAQISEKFDQHQFQFPIHNGTQYYLDRNKPSFLVQYAESMAFLLSVIIAGAGMIAASKQWIERMKKDRIDKYYLRLDDLLHDLNNKTFSEESISDIESELEKMRHMAVKDLVAEKLTPDESFRIFQSLLSDCLSHLRSKKLALEAGAK